jgi:hypothetical protein
VFRVGRVACAGAWCGAAWSNHSPRAFVVQGSLPGPVRGHSLALPAAPASCPRPVHRSLRALCFLCPAQLAGCCCGPLPHAAPTGGAHPAGAVGAFCTACVCVGGVGGGDCRAPQRWVNPIATPALYTALLVGGAGAVAVAGQAHPPAKGGRCAVLLPPCVPCNGRDATPAIPRRHGWSRAVPWLPAWRPASTPVVEECQAGPPRPLPPQQVSRGRRGRQACAVRV